MPTDRPLRADARRNRERVLDAARAAFAERGFDVPLDEIATRAGVGPGTVYRHFRTKEDLFRAVIAERVGDLAAAARRAADDPDSGAAFYGFLARLAAEAATKSDTSDALGIPSELHLELHAALTVLLARAQEAGAVRAGITSVDLVALLKSLLTVAREHRDRQQLDRLFTVVTTGLRP